MMKSKFIEKNMPAWFGKKSSNTKSKDQQNQNQHHHHHENVAGAGHGSGGFGFSGFEAHPLPQPSSISPTTSLPSISPTTSLPGGTDNNNNHGSGGSLSSSGGSSVSSADDSNNINFDQAQLGFFRGYGENKFSPRARTPCPGSRVATSPLHPRFATSTSLDSPNKKTDDGKSECHPLPLPPSSPTSPCSALSSNKTCSSPTRPSSVLSNMKTLKCHGKP